MKSGVLLFGILLFSKTIFAFNFEAAQQLNLAQASTINVVAINDMLPDFKQDLVSLSGKVVSVQPLCPEGFVCVVNGTMVRIQFILPGCMDRLGPVAYKVVPAEDGTLDIYLHATGVLSEASKHIVCFAPNVQSYDLSMINEFYERDEFRVHYLGSDAESQAFLRD